MVLCNSSLFAHLMVHEACAQPPPRTPFIDLSNTWSPLRSHRMQSIPLRQFCKDRPMGHFLCTLVYPMNPLLISVLGFLSSIYALLAHDGRMLDLNNHTKHHFYRTCNYGLYWGFWDYVFGTRYNTVKYPVRYIPTWQLQAQSKPSEEETGFKEKSEGQKSEKSQKQRKSGQIQNQQLHEINQINEVKSVAKSNKSIKSQKKSLKEESDMQKTVKKSDKKQDKLD